MGISMARYAGTSLGHLLFDFLKWAPRGLGFRVLGCSMLSHTAFALRVEAFRYYGQEFNYMTQA